MIDEQLHIVAIDAAALRQAAANLGGPGEPVRFTFVADFDALRSSLDEEAPDCAIVSCGEDMTRADGLLRDVRAGTVQTPIIFITNGADVEQALFMLRAGAAGCLDSSDLTPVKLSNAIWNAVRMHRAELRLARAQDRLTYYSRHDLLTGLPNRTLFFHYLEQAIEESRAQDAGVALLMLDINGFKAVNRSFGHAVGDNLLKQVAERLDLVLAKETRLARLGDDEFAVMLSTDSTLPKAISTTATILDQIRRPFLVDGNTFTVGVSIGIALYPNHAANAEEMLRRAHTAMRAAKKSGSRFIVYAKDVDGENNEALSLAHDLGKAIEQDQLVLHYQPKISMIERRVCGVEALIRWGHPKRGMLYPDSFITVAEEANLIDALTHWVTDTALSQVSEWRAAGIDLAVSVNLSARTLYDQDFPDKVAALLKKWNLPAASLMFELTESAIISDIEKACEIATRLHSAGVKISIDDFGTGYTSFSYLRKLPVREIKLDKSFVFNMAKAPDDLVIVGTLIELGQNLGLQVVAEGVEDKETWDLLRNLGCNIAQGHYMSSALEPAALADWLAKSPWAGETVKAKRSPSTKRSARVAS